MPTELEMNTYALKMMSIHTLKHFQKQKEYC